MEEKEVISRRGLAKKHAVVDQEVWQWKTTLEQARKVQRVTKAEVQAFALEAYKRAGITTFKASDGWYRRWRARWQNMGMASSNDAKTKISSEDLNLVHENNYKVNNENVSKKRNSFKNELVLPAAKVRRFEKSDMEESQRLCKEFQRPTDYKETLNSSLKLTSKAASESVTQIQGETGDSSFTQTLGLVAVKNKILPQSKSLNSAVDPLILNVNFIKLNQAKSQQMMKFNLPNTKDQTLHTSVDSCATTSLMSDSSSHNEVMSNLRSDSDVSGTKICVFKRCDQTNLSQISCNLQTITIVTSNVPTLINTAKLVKGPLNNHESVDKTESPSITSGEGSLGVGKSWALDSVQIDGNLTVHPQDCSQSNSGISVPSSCGSPQVSDHLMSSLFEEGDLDFSEHEHELFCDSCEDFHPRQRSLHTSCKQKKEATNSLLLSCVFEKKDLIAMSPCSLSNESRVDVTKEVPDAEESRDFRLSNPSVMVSKGKRYLVQFKSKVVNYALSQGVKQAAEDFRVNRNTVAEWLAERKRLSGCGPLRLVDQDVSGDSEFLAWLEDSKYNLTNELIKQKTYEWLCNSDQTGSRQCQWLRMYAHRLNGTVEKTVKKRYIVYPEAFKRAVVFHAQTHSNMAAARVFAVARRRIIEWQETAGDTNNKSDNKTANNVTDEKVDMQVYEWFRSQQAPPSSRLVRSKALELYREAGHHSIKCCAQWYYRWRARHKLPPPRDQLYSNTTPLLVWALSQLDNNKCVSQSALAAQAASLGHTKVSRGWTFRFCKKYHSLLQTVPEPDTPLPAVIERQVSDFRQKLCDVISTQSVPNSRIIALDEVPLHFLPKDRGKKPLLVRRPGFESCQASLLVSCLADGTLLPVLIVFKGTGPGATSQNDPQVITAVNDTGQVSNDIMLQWLTTICFPYLGDEGGVLITDSFDIHMNPAVQQAVTSRSVHLAVTPPGCAFRLLPVVSVCHSFKTMLEDMCQLSFSCQTASLQSPSPDQLYLWAVRVHKHIAKHHKEKITNSFKHMMSHQLPSHSTSS